MNSKQTLKQQTILTLAHKEFNKGLNSHAFFKVNNRATSEDLVQETFMKTWKYLVRGGKIETIKAFLYHVLNNLIVDEYRKRKLASLEEMTEVGYEPPVDDTEFKKLFNIIDGKTASLLIQRLPEIYKKIMILRFVKDLSLEEISLITGQTRNTVAVKVHRGLAKLRILYRAPTIA